MCRGAGERLVSVLLCAGRACGCTGQGGGVGGDGSSLGRFLLAWVGVGRAGEEARGRGEGGGGAARGPREGGAPLGRWPLCCPSPAPAKNHRA